MATPLTSRDRLQPSLLDRLLDDAPGHLQEGPEQRVLSRTQLKASVLRDLSWLLNSTALLDAEASRTLPAGSSVINYGLPALAGHSASGMDVHQLEQQIHRAIATFEPRILPGSLRVRALEAPDQRGNNALAFEIEGDLWAEPVPMRLLLQTDLDLETGEVNVYSAEHRRRT